MKDFHDNDHIFLHYIDGNMDASEAESLKDILDNDPESMEELFVSKHIADMARYGSMKVRDQERNMLELLDRMKKADRKNRRCRMFRQVAVYAAIFVLSFVSGALTLELMDGKDSTVIIAADAGNKSDVILPDGTKVILKSSSELTYNLSDFNSRQRKVTLEGEAYFDVTSDPDRKFIVRTQRQDVVVHGTTFNMRAFEGDRFNILTLLDGNVTTDIYSSDSERIRSIELHQLERCICDLKNGNTIVEKVDPAELDHRWDANVCYFKDSSLKHIASRLERYYNAEITIDDAVDEMERFTGAVSLSNPIGDVLKLINYDLRYDVIKHEDGKYTISINTNHN